MHQQQAHQGTATVSVTDVNLLGKSRVSILRRFYPCLSFLETIHYLICFPGSQPTSSAN